MREPIKSRPLPEEADHKIGNAKLIGAKSTFYNSDQIIPIRKIELPALVKFPQKRPVWEVINIDGVIVEPHNNDTPASQ